MILEAALGVPDDHGCPVVARATPRTTYPPQPCYVAVVLVGVRMGGKTGSLQLFPAGLTKEPTTLSILFGISIAPRSHQTPPWGRGILERMRHAGFQV